MSTIVFKKIDSSLTEKQEKTRCIVFVHIEEYHRAAVMIHMPNATFTVPLETLKKLRIYIPLRQRSRFVTKSLENSLVLESRKKALADRGKMRELAKKWGWDKGPSATSIIRKMRDTRY